MPEQIIITIARPEVGIEYRSESPEAETADRIAAVDLALHALARHEGELRSSIGLACPSVVKNLADSDLWMIGL